MYSVTVIIRLIFDMIMTIWLTDQNHLNHMVGHEILQMKYYSKKPSGFKGDGVLNLFTTEAIYLLSSH